MSRKAVKTTKDDFFKILKEKASKTEFFQEEFYPEEIEEMSDEALVYSAIVNQVLAKVVNDIKKVSVSFENVVTKGDIIEYPLGFTELPNGVSGYLFMVGGDWEKPVAAFLYYDGKSFRAYVPKEGNSYNKKYKCAYGSEPDGREYNVREEYDFSKILLDIENRIKLVSAPSVRGD